MAGKISSLMIWGILLIIILQFIPRSLAARNLENVPQPNGGNENETDNDQSKSGVNGSKPKQSGSAAGDSAPSGGVVQTPPSSFHKKTFSKTSNGSQTVTSTTNGRVTSNTTKSWNDRQSSVDWNGHQSATGSSSVNVTNNGNGSGGQVNSPPIAAAALYEAPQAPEDPRFHFPPAPTFTYP